MLKMLERKSKAAAVIYNDENGKIKQIKKPAIDITGFLIICLCKCFIY
jgi:hypothetical protein